MGKTNAVEVEASFYCGRGEGFGGRVQVDGGVVWLWEGWEGAASGVPWQGLG